MTTTSDDILLSLDGARDALVTAINNKGGSLSQDSTLYQCAGAVGSLSVGTSAEYYKCASVDTSAKTWSGYKAVFDSGTGTWSFSDTVTGGLSYTSVTPIVGGIYSADALVTVSMLYDGTVTLPGCVFYAGLKDNTSELKSGQTLTIPSSATFQTIGGVQCVQLNGTDQITFTP